MPIKRLAMTVDGKLTYCTADDEHIGKGRCNHIAHQQKGEDPQTFLERANQVMAIKIQVDDKKNPNTDLPDLSNISRLEEIVPVEHPYKSINGGHEGIVSDGNGGLKYVRLFHHSAFDAEIVNNLDRIYDPDCLEYEGDESPEDLFKRLSLPYNKDDIEANTDTYMEYVLKKNAEKYNSHPEFGEPQIELRADLDPEDAFGYSWPLDRVIDKLGDDSLVRSPAQMPGASDKLDNKNPSVKKLYSRIKANKEASAKSSPDAPKISKETDKDYWAFIKSFTTRKTIPEEDFRSKNRGEKSKFVKYVEAYNQLYAANDRGSTSRMLRVAPVEFKHEVAYRGNYSEEDAKKYLVTDADVGVRTSLALSCNYPSVLNTLKDDSDILVSTMARKKLGMKEEAAVKYTVRSVETGSGKIYNVYKGEKHICAIGEKTWSTPTRLLVDKLRCGVKKGATEDEIQEFHQHLKNHLYVKSVVNPEFGNSAGKNTDGGAPIAYRSHEVQGEIWSTPNFNQDNFYKKLGLDEFWEQSDGGWNGTSTILDTSNPYARVGDKSFTFDVIGGSSITIIDS